MIDKYILGSISKKQSWVLLLGISLTKSISDLAGAAMPKVNCGVNENQGKRVKIVGNVDFFLISKGKGLNDLNSN